MKSSSDSTLLQRLGLFSTIMIVTGSMVGSGIFKDPTDIASSLGIPFWYLLIWVIAGLLTLIGALSNAEVASMFPKTGGQYVYFKEMYGDVVAFFYGWSIFAVIQTGSIASIAYVFSEYAQTFVVFPKFSPSIEQSIQLYLPFIGTFYPLKEFGLKIVTVSIIILLSGVNILGVRSGSLIQNIFTVAKFLAVGALIVCSFIFAQNGFTHFQSSQSIVNHNSLSFLMAFIVAIQAAFWSYDGWNNITYVAGEVKNPQQTIPKALIIGAFGVMIFYVLTNAAFLYVLPLSAIASSTLLAKDVATVLFGGIGGYLVASAVMISTFGTTNGTILASARVYQAMAEDGYFFTKMKNIHPRFHTPHYALMLQAGWTSILVFSGTFRALTSMLIFVTWVYYALGVIGLFILRKKMPKSERPYKVNFYPYLPFIFVIFATAFVFLTLYTDIQMYIEGKVEVIHSLYGLFLVETVIPFYFYYVKKKKIRMELFFQVLQVWLWASLGFTFIEAYLKVNKLWKRKHERKVAEAQSIMGSCVALLAGLPFFFRYITRSDFESAIGSFVWLSVSVFIIFVGSGIWLQRDEKKLSFFRLIKDALKLEGTEVGNLAKALIRHPVGAKNMVEILVQIAHIDNEFHKKEREFIELFIEKWNINLSLDDFLQYHDKNENVNYSTLLKAVEEYLEILPPEKQVAQLIDTINELIHVDENIAEEEKMTVSEVTSMLRDYINQDKDIKKFEVCIVPRNTEQEERALSVLFDYKRKELPGGYVFSVAEYFSEEYAEMVCEEYRKLGLFAISIRIPEDLEVTN